MARPQKTGLNYFPLDVDFFSDNKIRILKARYGMDGIMVYIYLLCEIYKNGYYMQWNDDFKYILADELNLTDGFIEQVLTFLLERSLLNSTLFKSDTILTSPGIQKRYQLAVKERAKKRQIEIERFWLLKPEETESFIKVNSFLNDSRNNDSFSRNNSNKSPEKSLKESKVNKSKANIKISSELETSPRSAVYSLQLIDGSIYPVSQAEVEKYRELYPAVDADQEFRKMIGWLDSHPKNRKTRRGIAKFVNGWLSRAQDSARPEPRTEIKRNQFHNFDQRDTDYDAIVMEQAKKLFGGETEDGGDQDNHGTGGDRNRRNT